jgi:hypothetical protein
VSQLVWGHQCLENGQHLLLFLTVAALAVALLLDPAALLLLLLMPVLDALMAP